LFEIVIRRAKETGEILRRNLKKSSGEMSWQAFVDDHADDQLIATGMVMVNKSCIIGLDGGVWAQSAGFAVSVSIFLLLASIPC